MLRSLSYSQLCLRIGLAAVFLWFGIDKFIHPTYWVNAWVPAWAIQFLEGIGLTGRDFIYVNGIFEVLVGTSLLTNIFIRTFAFLSILFLLSVIIVNGFSEIVVRDVGLIGGFAAIIFWPKKSI